MHDLKSIVDAFNRNIDELRFTEALNTFYREDMISVDNDGTPVLGRQKMLELTGSFLERVRGLSTHVISTMISDHISVVEREYRFDMPDGAHYRFRQVSIQQWADARIWHERHLYQL